MNRANLFLVLGLGAGAVLGFFASGNGPKVDMDHPRHGAGGMSHDHDRLQEVSAGAVPAVQIALQSEGGCTYNILISLENFRFTPENVNGPHKDGEGHAHLYADGMKLARVYSEWFHFTAPSGSKSVELTLNSNDHATLAHQGKPIAATTQLTDC